jgi:tripartite ATP-independent transporter DctM subunit
MTVELVTILMFGAMMVLLVTGLPIVFCLGATALIFAFFLWGPGALSVISNSMAHYMNNFLMICIPLFLFMAGMLERSGLADDLYTMMHKWFGPLRGGLAIGTVVICTLFAAMSGVSAIGVVTMTLIALPAMLKRGYDKFMSVGAIAAGGALGILIPPSVPMVIYCLLANESVGSMFMGGIFPGLLLALLYILYIVIRCGINPKMGPPLPKAERATWNEKLRSLKAVILPILIVCAVLGSMFTGIATPTEAAAIGAIGSIISAAIYKKLRWTDIKESCWGTVRITAMSMWVIGGAIAFSAIYTGLGATNLIRSSMQGLDVNPLVIVGIMQVILLILGCFLDPTGIMMITLPIFIPILETLKLDLIWFGILFIMNMEMAFLTPPFGLNLFFLKGTLPQVTDKVSMTDVYRAIVPYVGIQALGLVIVMFFPVIATFLPNLLTAK